MPIYTYPQLKGRIKVGDTVIQDGKKKKVTGVGTYHFTLDYQYHHPYDLPNYSLELLEEKTLDTVDVGDVVADENGEEFNILDTSKNGKVLFLMHDGYIRRFEVRELLEKKGYTVKQGPQPVIMTCEEAERELSKDGKQVKIV